MTITPADLLLYAGALFVLFLTPGPVWVALVARTLSGGFHAAWPLALGVVVGDVLWPFLAILGVTWIVSVYAEFMVVLKWIAALTFIVMGMLIIRHADKTIASDSRLTKPGMWAGFLAGIAVIMGNPKAILFYMGALPSFFDFRTITAWDMVAICSISLFGRIPRTCVCSSRSGHGWRWATCGTHAQHRASTNAVFSPIIVIT